MQCIFKIVREIVAPSRARFLNFRISPARFCCRVSFVAQTSE